MTSSTRAPIQTYGFGTVVNLSYDQAIERTRAALKEQGFGVLTEIDVKATMKAKLDADFRPYVILGACNPPLAHRALSADLGIGLLLPCNVVVYERDGETHVAAIDAQRMLSVVENDHLGPVAVEVRDRLANVVERVAAA